MPGECGGIVGQTCMGCPAGEIAEHYICTTSCTSDADCTNPELPTCSSAGPGSSGICIPASGFTCCWLCG